MYPPYISLKWTANILSRSEPHISYLCRNGKLKSLKVAGSRIICRDSLREHAIEKGLDCTILGLRDALNPASEIYDIHSKAFKERQEQSVKVLKEIFEKKERKEQAVKVLTGVFEKMKVEGL